jgi:hypothetical protein
VYAVTGDRILLDLQVKNAKMGEYLRTESPIEIKVDIEGSDAVDRVELLRDGRVIETHCHIDSWPASIPDPVRFKLRLEFGWGPKASKGFGEQEKIWEGKLSPRGGRILSTEGCFTWPGQRIGESKKSHVEFRLVTPNTGGSVPWAEIAGPHVPTSVGAPGNQAVVTEFELPAGEAVHLEIDGTSLDITPESAMSGSKVVALLAESRRLTERVFGISADEVESPDSFYFNAWKMKMHQAFPESAYRFTHSFEDAPGRSLHYYYVRVTQLNGQMAWSSPVWVDCT